LVIIHRRPLPLSRIIGRSRYLDAVKIHLDLAHKPVNGYLDSVKNERLMPASAKKKLRLSQANAASARRRSGKSIRKEPKAKREDAYHHGTLKAALLDAAEKLLKRDGVAGLTLRAAAREAGVSHAAPKHHFGDLAGLLAELATVGFERLRNAMSADLRDDLSQAERLDAIGRGYVAFAKTHPALFLLMFRSERLDMNRPALRDATRACFETLSSASGFSSERSERLTLAQAGQLARAWSIVHGFAILAINGRWAPLLERLGLDADDDALFDAIIDGAPQRR
jgi:AcrR family transcriptional regulator